MKKIEEDQEYRVRAICAEALCKVLEKKYKAAGLILNNANISSEDPMIKVYTALNKILESGEKLLLSDDEKESSLYTALIFDLLKVILAVHEFDMFEKALELLNCVNDKTVLLRLAKLYYSENCYALACQELLRSIKTFDMMDAEGAELFYRLKLKGY